MEQFKHLDAQKQVYAAVIADGDKAVGKILAALKEAGVEQNTLIMFSSDNGPEQTGLGETTFDPNAKTTGPYGTSYSVGETGGLRGRKRSLFEGGVRTPFIVRWPGHTPAGVKNNSTVLSGVDLLPTFCAAAGVKLPNDYQPDGENLLEAFNGKAITRTRPIFWEWLGTKTEPDWWPRLAVRDNEWKLMMTEDGKRAELYQLLNDRAEAKDVAKDHPDIVARLTKLALDWKATLPEKPNPECLTTAPDPVKSNTPKKGGKGPGGKKTAE
jgi:N-acetylgalactosamine-6-sulfatase